MKVLRCIHEGTTKLGLSDDERCYDLSAAHLAYRLVNDGIEEPRITDLLEFIRRGFLNVEYLGKLLDFVNEESQGPKYALCEPYQLLAPLIPSKVVALCVNYKAHAKEGPIAPPEEPAIFCKPSTAIIGPEQEIVIKDHYGRVDPEVELAIVINKRATDVSKADAWDYVGGYTIFNDVTARELQRKDIGNNQPFFRSKGIDTFGPMGPWIVLPDEIQPPVELDLECSVNGEVRQKGNTRDLMFDIPALIEFISSFITLEPGDIVSTGTPQGIQPVTPGDVVELKIEKIGVLRNPVAKG